jgi:hypothetical protein
MLDSFAGHPVRRAPSPKRLLRSSFVVSRAGVEGVSIHERLLDAESVSAARDRGRRHDVAGESPGARASCSASVSKG